MSSVSKTVCESEPAPDAYFQTKEDMLNYLESGSDNNMPLPSDEDILLNSRNGIGSATNTIKLESEQCFKMEKDIQEICANLPEKPFIFGEDIEPFNRCIPGDTANDSLSEVAPYFINYADANWKDLEDRPLQNSSDENQASNAEKVVEIDGCVNNYMLDNYSQASFPKTEDTQRKILKPCRPGGLFHHAVADILKTNSSQTIQSSVQQATGILNDLINAVTSSNPKTCLELGETTIKNKQADKQEVPVNIVNSNLNYEVDLEMSESKCGIKRKSDYNVDHFTTKRNRSDSKNQGKESLKFEGTLHQVPELILLDSSEDHFSKAPTATSPTGKQSSVSINQENYSDPFSKKYAETSGVHQEVSLTSKSAVPNDTINFKTNTENKFEVIDLTKPTISFKPLLALPKVSSKIGGKRENKPLLSLPKISSVIGGARGGKDVAKNFQIFSEISSKNHITGNETVVTPIEQESNVKSNSGVNVDFSSQNNKKRKSNLLDSNHSPISLKSHESEQVGTSRMKTNKPRYKLDDEEENDLRNTKSALHSLKSSSEFFDFVQKQWNPLNISNPHQNLTCRFVNRKSQINNTIQLHSDRSSGKHGCSSIYQSRINVVKNSLDSIHKEIVGLVRKQKYNRDYSKKSEDRIHYVKRQRNRLSNMLTKLTCARNEVDAVYKKYVDKNNNWSGGYLTNFDKAEIEYSKKIFDKIQTFYDYPN